MVGVALGALAIGSSIAVLWIGLMIVAYLVALGFFVRALRAAKLEGRAR